MRKKFYVSGLDLGFVNRIVFFFCVKEIICSKTSHFFLEKKNKSKIKEISKGCVFISFYSSVKNLTLMTSFLEMSLEALPWHRIAVVIIFYRHLQHKQIISQHSNYTQMFCERRTFLWQLLLDDWWRSNVRSTWVYLYIWLIYIVYSWAISDLWNYFCFYFIFLYFIFMWYR